MLDRRQFALALAALPLGLKAAGRPRIVVVGAGAGGLAFIAALRRRLALRSVILHVVEPRPHYMAPFGTPRVLCGEAASARLPYPDIRDLRWHRARLQGLDPARRQLRLSNGQRLAYDFLLLAPGLEAAETLPGREHLAWFNDDSLTELLRRLQALPPRAEIVLSVPPLPYRCPPAPYERAGLIIGHLRRLGRDDAHLTLLDAKESFSLQAHVLSDWERRWPGRIQWLPPSVHEGITEIRPDGVITGFGRFAADLVHAIPAQQAPAWCREAGLADATGYCPVELPSFRSRAADEVYVIGDAAAAGDMPKSASAALSQAEHAAADLAARLGEAHVEAPALASRCYSRLDRGVAISSHSRFDAGGRRLREDLSPYPLEPDAAAAEYAQAEAWYRRTLQAMGLQADPTESQDRSL